MIQRQMSFWKACICSASPFPSLLFSLTVLIFSTVLQLQFCILAAFAPVYENRISSLEGRSALSGGGVGWGGYMDYCKCLEHGHSVEEILTAIVTTVRSAKAVITTFCRMLSCRGQRQTDLLSP